MSRAFSHVAAALLGSVGLIAARAEAQQRPVSPTDFLGAASCANAYEITAAQVALAESRNPAVRAFATTMIRDHTAAETALDQAAARSQLPPPVLIVGSDQAALLAALQSLRGADFDHAYVRQQRLVHRAALAMESGYAHTGSDPNLRQAAATDLPMIQHHLQVADGLSDLVARGRSSRIGGGSG